MGCTTARERIESKMLTLKLQRVCILEQKKKYFQDFEKLTGKKINRKEVPDYIPFDEKKRLKIKSIKIINSDNEEENYIEKNDNDSENYYNNENNSEKEFEFKSLNNDANIENEVRNLIKKKEDKNKNKINNKDKIDIEENESIDNIINLKRKKNELIENNNNINKKNNNIKLKSSSVEQFQFTDKKKEYK